MEDRQWMTRAWGRILTTTWRSCSINGPGPDARQHRRFTQAAAAEELARPWEVLDRDGWLTGGLEGRRLLCLAAGGGRHGPLYAAAGARVTVVDIIPLQLEMDRQVATARGLQLRTVESSMDDLSMFPSGDFDVVIQPVSTCYVPDVRAVYRAVARVTAAGGAVHQPHKQPTSLQATVQPNARGYGTVESYYRQGPFRPVAGSPHP